jgi:GNAT superfamily N-acetyltransferase
MNLSELLESHSRISCTGVLINEYGILGINGVLNIRNYQSLDSTSFGELLILHYQEMFPAFIANKNFISDYSKAIARQSINVICAEDKDIGIVGFLVFCGVEHPIYERKDFFVREVYVAENFRGIRLASEMVQFFKDQSSTENGKMFVDLQFGNNGADKFWRSAGFLPFQQRYILDE